MKTNVLLLATLVLVALMAISGCAKGTTPSETEPANNGAPPPDNNDAPPVNNDAPPVNNDSPEPVCGDNICDNGEDCPEDCEDEPDKCENDMQCPPGQLCIDSNCTEGDCREDGDCASAGETCQDNVCVADREPEVVLFELEPAQIIEGQSAVLRWDAKFADSVQIVANPANQTLGDVDASGSHTAIGTEDVTFTIQASNATGQVQEDVSLSVVPRLVMLIPGLEGVPEANVGQPYRVVFETSGGEGEPMWSLQGALPQGLSFDTGTAELSGVPTQSGRFPLTVRVRDQFQPAQEVSREVELVVTAEPLEILTESLPDAPVDTLYEAQLQARGGVGPYRWEIIAGSLPEGLQMTPEGLIAGTPTVQRSLTVSVELSDSADPPQVLQANYTINVVPPALRIVTQALPAGLVGQAFDFSFQGAGGTEPYTWIISGQLPAGLSLFDNRITGTPTEPLTSTLTVQLRDRDNNEVFDDFELQVDPGPLSLLTEVLPEGRIGQPYDVTLEATGGAQPYQWIVQNLPDGLILDPPTGRVSGQPEVFGSFNVSIRVESADAQSAQRSVSLLIMPPGLNIDTQTLPDGRVGEAYNVSLEASGGAEPFSWSAVGDLPDGLSIQGAALVGTPNVAGTFDIELEVTDSAEQSTRRTFASVEIAPLAPQVSTAALPDGRVGEAYSFVLEGIQGQAPYTWSVVGGALPDGLALAGDGTISGSPTTAGSASVTVRLEDQRAEQAEATLALEVLPPVLRVVTESLPQAQVDAAYSASLEATGGSEPFVWTVSAGALPEGVSLAEDGAISGTPVSVGTFDVTFQVSDQSVPSQQASQALSIVVAAGVLEIQPETLPGGTAGEAYSAPLVAVDAQAPVVWSVSAGTLPPGVTLEANGELVGVPTQDGAFEFTVQAQDARQSVGQRVYTVTIEAAPAPPLVNAIAGSFVDISQTAGEPLAVSNLDDGVSDALPIGFEFEFFGETYTELQVASNGLVMFEDPQGASVITNTAFPSTAGPENLIAVFWDDLAPDDAGSIFMETRGTAPLRRTIIQWHQVDFFSGDNTQLNFELILYEGTNQVQLLYGVSTQGSLNPGRVFGQFASAGIENAAGDRGVELFFDQPDAVLPGQVYLLTPNGDDYDLDGWNSADGDFVDISTTGTEAELISGDDSSQQIPIGFDFSFYGTTRTEVFASSNGFMTFVNESANTFTNVAMPAVASPNAVVAPYWDDLTPREGSAVFHQVLGTAPFRRFVVQWNRFGRIGAADTRLTFQAVLHETSNLVSFHYGPMDYTGGNTYFQGQSATVGIEDDGGANAMQVSFNSPDIRQGGSVYFVPEGGGSTNRYLTSGHSEHFIDIRHSGTRLETLDNRDDGFEEVSIGFDFPFDGQTFAQLAVSTNGFVRFGGTAGASSLTNQSFPNALEPNGILAPFWDDLDPALDNNRGQILIETRGTAPNRQFIVQWQSTPHNLSAASSLTFQVVLGEDGSVVYNYGALVDNTGNYGSLASASVGLENLTGTLGSTHSFNQRGAVRSGGQVRVLVSE